MTRLVRSAVVDGVLLMDIGMEDSRAEELKILSFRAS
jgi:hypothetical protein